MQLLRGLLGSGDRVNISIRLQKQNHDDIAIHHPFFALISSSLAQLY